MLITAIYQKKWISRQSISVIDFQLSLVQSVLQISSNLKICRGRLCLKISMAIWIYLMTSLSHSNEVKSNSCTFLALAILKILPQTYQWKRFVFFCLAIATIDFSKVVKELIGMIFIFYCWPGFYFSETLVKNTTKKRIEAKSRWATE